MAEHRDNGHAARQREERRNGNQRRSERSDSKRSNADRSNAEHSNADRSNGHRAATARSPSPTDLARYAAEQLSELVGREPEGVVSLERTDDGWCIGIEVVETHRIPDTADILAEYAVDVDRRGDLVGYRRTRRYSRGRAQEES